MAMLALIVPLGSTGGPVDPGFGVPAPPSGGGAPVYPSHPIALPPGVWPSPIPPVDPGYGRPSWGAGHPSHPIAGVPPMYPSGQPVPPGWGGGQPPHPWLPGMIGGGNYPSGQPVPPFPIVPPPGGGGGGGSDGDVAISNPIGGGHVVMWHPAYGFVLVPAGGLPPLTGSGTKPDQGLPPTAEPKSY